MNNNDLMIGVAGEHLVCFDLIAKGFTAFMTEQGLPYDLIADINGKSTETPINANKIYLQVKVTSENGGNQFYYSTDNKKFVPFAEAFSVGSGNWKGPKIGLFSYNEKENGGSAAFDWLHYIYEGPQNSLK